MFRRNFDAEDAARARGERPRGCPSFGATTDTDTPIVETGLLVIPRSPKILDRLLALKLEIEPAGEDWHIRCRTRAETEGVIALCKLARIHGVLRRPRQAPVAMR